MKRLKDKRFTGSFLISTFVIFMFIFFEYFDITGLMGNSVIKSYYYCQDSSYTLKGNSCSKKLSANVVLMGDINQDGTIDSIDATMIIRYVEDNSYFDDFKKKLADVNGDNVVDSKDSELLQKYISEMDITNNKIEIGKEAICPLGYNRVGATEECIKEEVVKAKKVDFVLGDVNADMKVDSNDSKLIQEYVSGIVEFNDVQKKAADTNKDGNINQADMNKKTSSNSVKASVNVLNNINNIELNSKINYQANFTVTGNKKYYYKWFDVKNSGNGSSSACKSLTSSIVDNYSINVTHNNEYVLLRIYDDSSCSSIINEYKTNYIRLKEEKSGVSLDYKLVSHNLTTNIVNYQTELKFDASFKIVGNSKYYYRWSTISNNRTVTNTNCSQIVNGNKNFSFKVNGKDIYGKWDLYNDASCTKLVKSYSTNKYNFYASSISLNPSSYTMNIGGTYTLNPKVESNLTDANSYIKYSSSNVSVATVNNSGIVTAKSSGKATIKATIGNLSSSIEITVNSNNNDLSLVCPQIKYTEDDSKTSFTVNPNKNTLKYDVYLSTNNHVGTYAEYALLKSGATYSSTYNNLYKGEKSNQAKIVIYDKNGNSRNCYTPPLTWRWNTRSVIASCPSFNQQIGNKISGVSNYTIKNGDNNVYTGISTMNISFNTSNDYQYTYYESKKGGGYKLVETYPNSSGTKKYNLISEIYNKNIKIVVTDKRGNNISCVSDSINKLNLKKTSVGSTNIYYETTTVPSDKDTVIREMNLINSWSPGYLAASSITVYSENTYLTTFGDGTCGYYHPSSNNISLRASTPRCGGSSNSAWYVGAIHHEFGHSMDWMNGRLSGTNLANLKYDGIDLTYYKEKYYNKKLCNNNKNYCLRFNGSNYTDSNVELIADIFSYEKHGFYGNSEWKNLRTKMFSNVYLNNYNSNKNKFNSIKESFK